MALYSQPDYYVKTFTARNCSLRITTIETAAPLNLVESGLRPFLREPKQNVCLSRLRPCWSKSLISNVGSRAVGRFGALKMRAALFSVLRFSLPLAGDLRKSGSLYLRIRSSAGTGCVTHGSRGASRTPRPGRSAPKQCAARLIRAATVPAGRNLELPSHGAGRAAPFARERHVGRTIPTLAAGPASTLPDAHDSPCMT
jgi:hypothetical protein